ncbi:Crp/Fnr family transcriptional regulator [Lentibacillus saliphilus]|uniref:Crp/Fnr family transcriptional regulator n=1 Tax=Lentibacillus saliphilus TaxID=2737028 RepID=UPI001FE7E8A6|nr:Crp/Fnr family transcriptional regulator [Lentibacillus saliphilus]
MKKNGKDVQPACVSQLCVTKVPFFNHLETDDMLKIVKLSRHKHYSKGDIIHQAGDTLDYLHIVHKGRVKIYYLYESGKEQLIRILEPGEFMGELALFTQKVVDSYAEAMTTTDICTIHRHDIQNLMQDHPSIAMKILEQFSDRLDQTEKLVGQLSVKDAEARTAHYLVEQAMLQNRMALRLPMSKKELASHLGTTQETISRRLAQFQTNGWILQNGQRDIEIKNLPALKEAASMP